jgi:histidinol-phosphate phosphatase family protein
VSTPTQAVVLCGGLGTRLRPLTDRLPKPMAPIHGRPFLAYLIEQLRDQGIRRIVLLTGYRGGMIREYFGSGAPWPVAIEYSEGPVEWETARRIWEARAMLDERFLLTYSDNFVPFNLEKLSTCHAERGSAVTFVVQPKAPGNVRLAADGTVAAYDPGRAAPDLDHVEIGYMIVEREAMLAELDQIDVSFSCVLRRLAEAGRLGAAISRDPYHSISDLERWKLAERYLEAKRIMILDRDGTINERAPRGEYVRSWSAFRWIPETVTALRRLANRDFRFIVVSNQAGIGRGVLDPETVHDINRKMVAELGARGVDVLDVYVCPHDWDAGCGCRKPEPGLFFRASRDHLLRLDRTVYVGDDPRDSRAAFNAECLSVLVGPERDGDPGGGARPAFSAPTMMDAVPWIVWRFEAWEADLRLRSEGSLTC